jgi:hypothetical protein
MRRRVRCDGGLLQGSGARGRRNRRGGAVGRAAKLAAWQTAGVMKLAARLLQLP